MRLRLSLPAVLALALAACPVGPPTVDGANITCKTNADCLPGEVCDAKFGLCIAGPDAGSPGAPDGGDGGVDAGQPDGGDGGQNNGPKVCTIGGQTFDAGAFNPNDPCQACQPSVSASSFSPFTGLPLDGGCTQAGEVCNAGSCAAGCIIPDVGFEAAGAAEVGNPCDVCEPASTTAGWTSFSGLPPGSEDAGCGAGQVCNQGECFAGCFIADAGFAHPGHVDVRNPCQACDPSTTVSAYTPFTGFASDAGCGPGQTCCGEGQVCDNGACAAGCIVNGGFIPDGSVDLTGCASCNSAVSVSAIVPLPDDTPCTSGGTYCQAGSCVDACLVGGSLFDAGAVEAGNGCESCQPQESATAFSPVTNGTLCASAGNYCQAGACGFACDIGGTFYSPGQQEPGDACQLCAAATAGQPVTSFSNAPDQTPCSNDGGTFCQGGACVPDCLIGGALIPGGTIDAGNPNVCCNVQVSATGWTAGFGSASTTPNTSFAPNALAIGDVTGDGIPDLVVAESTANQLEILKGSGSGTFTLLSPALTFPSGSGPSALALADFNGDGFLDVAVADNGSNSVTILLNQTDGGFATSTVSGIKKPTALVVADLQAPGSRDLVVGALESTAGAAPEVVALLNQSLTGTFVAGPNAVLTTPVLGLAAGNFSNATGQVQVAALGSHAVTVVSIQVGTATMSAGNAGTVAGAASLVSLGAADLNGDGFTDLAVADQGNNEVIPLLNNGSAAFTAQTALTINSPSAVVTGNFNGSNGLPDVAAASGNGNVLVFINQTATGATSTTFFTPAPSYPVGAQPVALAASALTSDGLPALVTASNADSNLSVLLGQCP